MTEIGAAQRTRAAERGGVESGLPSELVRRAIVDAAGNQTRQEGLISMSGGVVSVPMAMLMPRCGQVENGIERAAAARRDTSGQWTMETPCSA